MKSVVLCGSRRFKNEVKEFAQALRNLGVIVYEPPLFTWDSWPAEFDEKFPDIKKLVITGLTHDHFYKIKMADVVFVYNKDGYSGPSTTLEIGAACVLSKPIYALAKDEELCRQVLFREIVASPEELVKKLQ